MPHRLSASVHTVRSILRKTPRIVSTLAALAMLASAPRAQAQDEFEHRHALGGKVGTTGLGLEYSYAWSEFPQFGLRVNANAGSYSREATRRNVRYDGKAEFRSLMLLADAHPFRNGFRLSAGLAWNRNVFRATGVPVGGTFSINDVSYPADAVTDVSGEITVQPLSPYFGIGWGAVPDSRGRAFFSVDFGLMYQRPDVRLRATCGPSFPAAECSRLQDDLLRQEQTFRADLIKYGRMWPVLNIGGGYRF